MARLSHSAISGGERTEAEAMKKGPWTAAEDAMLTEYVRRHGGGNWNAVQKNTGLARCGKSCRLRWANHLRPNLKKGAFSPQEEQIIIDLHANLGNKWARMASQLPGRTDNEIKNYWNTRMKRRQRSGLPIYPNDQHQQLHQTSQYSHHHHHHHNSSPNNSSFQSLVSANKSYNHHRHFDSHKMKPMCHHHDPRALSHYNFSLSLMPFNNNQTNVSTQTQMISNDPYTFQYCGHLPGTLSSMLSAPELPSSETPAASDGSGGITCHGYDFGETSNKFVKSGLLGDLVVEGQAIFHNTNTNDGNENEASLLEEDEKGKSVLLVKNEEESKECCTVRSSPLTFHYADTESTESTTDNFSSCEQSSIGGMEQSDDRIDASSNMDDDLMSLLNNFPASSSVPEYPDWYCGAGGTAYNHR